MATTAWTRQTRALVVRNGKLLVRDWKALFTAVVVPLIYMVVLIVLVHVVPPSRLPGVGAGRPMPVGANHRANTTQQAAPKLLLAFAPSAFHDVMAQVVDPSTCEACAFANASLLALNSSQDLDRLALPSEVPVQDPQSETITAAVVFANASSPPSLNITLRFPPGQTPPATSASSQSVYTCRANTSCLSYLYVVSNFLALETDLAVAISKGNLSIPEASVATFPLPAVVEPPTYLSIMTAIYVPLAFWPLVVSLITAIVMEKEKKLKDFLAIMGMSESAYIMSQLITFGVLGALTTILLAIALVAGGVYAHSNFFLIWIILVLYAMTAIGYALCITPFFTTTGAAVNFGILLACLGVLYIPLTMEPASSAALWACCLVSPVALGLAMGQAMVLELQDPQTGVQFSTMWQGVAAPGFSVGAATVMLLLDIPVYLALAWYLDSVIPTELGPKRKPWFVFTRAFWFPPMMTPTANARTSTAGEDERGSHTTDGPVAIRIEQLGKVYNPNSAQPTVALADVSFQIGESEIHGIVGGNAAGKSTLMSVLTGVIPPSSGTAHVFGLDVRTQAHAVRSSLGMCPQENRYFDRLTVREHVHLAFELRGGSTHPSETSQTLEHVLTELDLMAVQNQHAATLSGGQKRKLGVAMAVAGSPRVIVLDEPTAGMDVRARRLLGNALAKFKQGRVILIASHYMDEIDALADRLTLLSNGRVCISGSPLFLKTRFGLGYHLTLDVSAASSPSEIALAIQRDVPRAECLDSSTRSRMHFRLPADDVRLFPGLLRNLARSAGEWGFIKRSSLNSGFSLNMTTLEDVFVRLEGGGGETEPEQDKPPSTTSSSFSSHHHHQNPQEMVMNSGTTLHQPDNRPPLPWSRFRILTRARILQTRRAPRTLLVILVMAFVLEIVGFAIGRVTSASAFVSASSTRPDSVSLGPDALPRVPPAQVVTGNQTSTDNLDALLLTALAFPWIPLDNNNNTNQTDCFARLRLSAALVNDSSSSSSQRVSVNASIAYEPHLVHGVAAYWSQTLAAAVDVAGGPMVTFFSQALPTKATGIAANAAGSLSMVLLAGLAGVLLPFSLATELVREAESGLRHQLRLAGVGSTEYWGATMVRDGMAVAAFALASFILLCAFRPPCLGGPALLPAFFGFILSPPCILLFAYSISLLFDKSRTFMAIAPLASVLGVLPMLVVAFLALFGLESTSYALHYVFAAFLPPYSLVGLLWVTCVAHSEFDTTQGIWTAQNGVVGWTLLLIVEVTLVWAGILWWFAAEGRRRRRLWPWVRPPATSGGVGETTMEDVEEALTGEYNDKDADVRAERLAVCQRKRNDVVRVWGISKTFPGTKDAAPKSPNPPREGDARENIPASSSSCLRQCLAAMREDRKRRNPPAKIAVNDIWFGVQRGECLAFLGPNGSGKSVSLDIITGRRRPTSGRVEMAPDSTMGYSPQFDALFEDLTMAEQVTLACELHSVVRVADRVQQILDALHISAFRDVKARHLSGGTRRKLSFCLAAMTGSPSLLVLDEPSCGMDPASRRFMWSAVRDSVQGRACLLTTHNMEEADALSDRVAVIVEGSLRAVGSSAHIKAKFGDGYRLEVRLAPGVTKDVVLGRLQSELQEQGALHVPGEELGLEDRIVMRLPDSGGLDGLANAFEVALNLVDEQKQVTEFSVSQATLERAFARIVDGVTLAVAGRN